MKSDFSPFENHSSTLCKLETVGQTENVSEEYKKDIVNYVYEFLCTNKEKFDITNYEELKQMSILFDDFFQNFSDKEKFISHFVHPDYFSENEGWQEDFYIINGMEKQREMSDLNSENGGEYRVHIEFDPSDLIPVHKKFGYSVGRIVKNMTKGAFNFLSNMKNTFSPSTRNRKRKLECEIVDKEDSDYESSSSIISFSSGSSDEIDEISSTVSEYTVSDESESDESESDESESDESESDESESDESESDESESDESESDEPIRRPMKRRRRC
jgi:hypothetical protein